MKELRVKNVVGYCRMNKADEIFNIIVETKEKIFNENKGKEMHLSSYVLDKAVSQALANRIEQSKSIYIDTYKEWNKRHFWWCLFWQIVNHRECNDYDGVCLHCRKDRYPPQ